MKRHWKALLAAGSLLVAAQAAAEVTVTEAWVRGTVPAQKATGVFMKLKSSEDAKLVAAASPSAKIVEVHEMAMKGNVMEMRAVESLALPAGKTVELKPGGYHVMLIDLAKPLNAGEKVPVTLTVVGKDGRKSTLELQAEVRTVTGAPMKH
jgi:copper(I)-binding protein